MRYRRSTPAIGETAEGAAQESPSRDFGAPYRSFAMDVSRHVDGIPDEEGILQMIRPAQENFKRAIRGTAPQFRPFERNLAGTQTLPAPTFLGNEDDGEAVEVGEDQCIYVDEVQTRALQ